MQRPINGFKKGVSGNPKGRPKGIKTIPEMLREIGDRPVDDVLLAKLHAKYGPAHNPKTLHEAMLMAARKDAATGDEHARTFIAERTEGKVKEHVEFSEEAISPDSVSMLTTAKLLETAYRMVHRQ